MFNLTGLYTTIYALTTITARKYSIKCEKKYNKFMENAKNA
jgi:hypothetical protein